ncbi:hypothetical protein [Methylocella sp. CPCC 101449]|uniref:hypothetical protein n=1 Tax=Methylocella sp. CPCC 101449 TaxID=2987531 RepID=UPI002892448E|nr:hypothetical protein [Methylocella sp. CPCC 101449]MDT2020473.1 hypothetical protein [Methylocella sp. CPCC 101449]
MFEIAKRLWGSRGRAQPSSVVTVDKMREVFAYGAEKGVTGLSLPEQEVRGNKTQNLARLIDWQAEPRDWTIKVAIKQFQLGDTLVIPPHIKWSANPLFAYVGIVDGAVEFRCGNDRASAWFLCPKAEQAEDISKIETLFQFWYDKFGLPQSLTGGAASVDGATTASDTPIRGFKVFAHRYPNHTSSPRVTLSAPQLAEALSREMDVAWFGTTPEMTHFAVTDLSPGTGDHEGAIAFDFGPYDESAEGFTTRHTVIVRTTAGGGFMLLVQDAAAAYGPKVADFFDKVIAEASHPLS